MPFGSVRDLCECVGFSRHGATNLNVHDGPQSTIALADARASDTRSVPGASSYTLSL